MIAICFLCRNDPTKFKRVLYDTRELTNFTSHATNVAAHNVGENNQSGHECKFCKKQFTRKRAFLTHLCSQFANLQDPTNYTLISKESGIGRTISELKCSQIYDICHLHKYAVEGKLNLQCSWEINHHSAYCWEKNNDSFHLYLGVYPPIHLAEIGMRKWANQINEYADASGLLFIYQCLMEKYEKGNRYCFLKNKLVGCPCCDTYYKLNL